MKTPRKPVNRSPEASPPPPPPPPPPWDAYARLCRGWASMLLERQQQGTDKYKPPRLWVLDVAAQRIPEAGPLADLAAEGVVTGKAGAWTAQEAGLACSPMMMMALAPTEPWKPSEEFLQTAAEVAPALAAQLRERLGVAPPDHGAVIRARFAQWWDMFGWAWGQGLIPDGPALRYSHEAYPDGKRADCLGGGDLILAKPPVGHAPRYNRGWETLPVYGLARLEDAEPAPALSVQRERAAALLLHVSRKLLPLLPAEWVKPEWLNLGDYLLPWDSARQAKMDAWVAREQKRRAELRP